MGRILFIFLMLFSLSALAQVRLFLSSDSHANYERAILYMQSTEALQEQAQNSLWIHIFNGDISGSQKSTYFDQGWTLYKMMALLGQTANVVINIGNHEGHDFSNRGNVPESKKNKLFIDQNRFLISQLPNFRLTTANFEIKSEYKDLFQHFQDYKIASGKNLRIIGLGLENYFTEASYSPHSQYNWLQKINSGEVELKRQLIKASQENIDAVIVMAHDGFAYVRSIMENINSWKNDPQVLAKYPKLKNIKIPVALGGHEHAYHQEKIGETQVVESGFNFDFTMADLDSNLDLKDIKLFKQEDQEKFSKKNLDNSKLSKAKKLLENEIKKNDVEFSKALGPTLDHMQALRDLFKMPTYLGTNIATSFQEWAQNYLNISNADDVVAFINPTSYRPKTQIPQGNLSFGQLLDFVPYPGQTSIFVATGDVIQKIYFALRSSGEGKPYVTFLPFIPSNFHEGENKVLLDSKNVPLIPTKKYFLVLDQWLSINGHKIEVMNELIARLQKIDVIGNREQQDIIKHYLVPKLNSKETSNLISASASTVRLCSELFK